MKDQPISASVRHHSETSECMKFIKISFAYLLIKIIYPQGVFTILTWTIQEMRQEKVHIYIKIIVGLELTTS